MLVWLSQLLFEPTSNSSTTRTPRSTSRRAIKHWAPNDDRSLGRRAVEPERVRRLAADVKCLGCLAHQSVGGVDRCQARREERVARMRGQMGLVQVARASGSRAPAG